VPDLRQESRFPTFTPQALAAGLAAVFTFPLFYGDSRLGALDLYRDATGDLTAESMMIAQTLADVASAYLANAQARADLQDATAGARGSALHDPLTALPNRLLLLDRLDQAFIRSRRTRLTSAVVFVDLDGFKGVNDSFGHNVGDHLLMAVAERLKDELSPADTLARISADTFVIVCEDLASPAAAEAIVARLEAGLAAGFVVSGIELAVTASIGVAFSGRGPDTAESRILCTPRVWPCTGPNGPEVGVI
jgi:diguanylate cyclase (GGDEF)-like protein